MVPPKRQATKALKTTKKNRSPSAAAPASAPKAPPATSLPDLTKEWDVIVVGAGPAGAIAAMYLARAGKSVLLVDKSRFPRDKICGDAQGRKLAAIMKELGIYEAYTKLPGVPIYGLRLSSPDGSQMDMELVDRATGTPGYCLKRMHLDNFLFQNAVAFGAIPLEQTIVLEILQADGDITGLKVRSPAGEAVLKAKLYIGADGATSVFARTFKLESPPEHLIVATRAYYKGVTDMANNIEIHMIKELIPGYFWIFPLPNGEVNVGLGMVVSDKTEKAKTDPVYADLRELHKKVIAENPVVAPRFANAQLLDGITAWNLPVASHRRKAYGPCFLLLGDAASLINPLSGEGVGTASISGKLAAQVALEALEKNDFSEAFLQAYDTRLWAAIGQEMETDYKIQKIGKQKPHLIDKVVRKALTSPGFRRKLEGALPYVEGKKKISGWRFMLSLYF